MLFVGVVIAQVRHCGSIIFPCFADRVYRVYHERVKLSEQTLQFVVDALQGYFNREERLNFTRLNAQILVVLVDRSELQGALITKDVKSLRA